MTNETMAVTAFTSARVTSCCSRWRRSPRSSAQSNFSSPLLFPFSNCGSVYGSNLANRSHIVLLIKFNNSAATSGVWDHSERKKLENKAGRRTEERVRVFFWHKKLVRKKEVKKNVAPLPLSPNLNRLHHDSVKA